MCVLIYVHIDHIALFIVNYHTFIYDIIFNQLLTDLGWCIQTIGSGAFRLISGAFSPGKRCTGSRHVVHSD